MIPSQSVMLVHVHVQCTCLYEFLRVPQSSCIDVPCITAFKLHISLSMKDT